MADNYSKHGSRAIYHYPIRLKKFLNPLDEVEGARSSMCMIDLCYSPDLSLVNPG